MVGGREFADRDLLGNVFVLKGVLLDVGFWAHYRPEGNDVISRRLPPGGVNRGSMYFARCAVDNRVFSGQRSFLCAAARGLAVTLPLTGARVSLILLAIARYVFAARAPASSSRDAVFPKKLSEPSRLHALPLRILRKRVRRQPVSSGRQSSPNVRAKQKHGCFLRKKTFVR